MIIVISTYNLFFASEIQTFSSGHSRYFLDIFLVSSVHFPEMVHTRWFPGISRQKPWKDANKKRFVTTRGGVLASDHRHGDRITESCFGSPTSSLASLLVFFGEFTLPVPLHRFWILINQMIDLKRMRDETSPGTWGEKEIKIVRLFWMMRLMMERGESCSSCRLVLVQARKVKGIE